MIRRAEVRPFSDGQIALLKTFADQAVIAIENVRLFHEAQARNRDLAESLERQTAMSDILRVISSSPTDIQPVFETIAESAARLCSARFCSVFRFDGELIHFVAQHGWPVEAIEAQRRPFPMRPGRGSGASRAILSGAVEQISNLEADPEYQLGEATRAIKAHSVLAIPMLRNGRPVGSINIGRQERGYFPPRQIELLQTFADQAVIAIENVRLFEEVQARTRDLAESLQQQTATADVLKLISRSAFNLDAVLQTLVIPRSVSAVQTRARSHYAKATTSSSGPAPASRQSFAHTSRQIRIGSDEVRSKGGRQSKARQSMFRMCLRTRNTNERRLRPWASEPCFLFL